jgi:hypothetical protein
VKLEIVDAPDRESVNGNYCWSDRSLIIFEEATERATLSQREELPLLVLQGCHLKPRGEGVKGDRLKTFSKAVYETIEPAPPEHGESFNVT